MTDLIYDANSLFARSWFAVMAKPDGTPNAVIAAALYTVLSLLNTSNGKLGERVDRLLFAWDGRNKRDKGRDEKPKQYHPTKELLIEYLSFLLHPTHVCLDTHEADDVVATAVNQSEADLVFVASGDKDLQQLANERVSYYCLNHKAVLSMRAIRDKWHIKHPSQVAIALAIIGDKADLVEGINGWGPKAVQKLFHSVPDDFSLEETILALEQEIPERFRDGFWRDLDLTLLQRELPGVPPPSPVVMAPLEAVAELQLAPNFLDYYRPVYRLYNAVSHVDAQGDEEDAPPEY